MCTVEIFTNHTCKYFYKENSDYRECRKEEIVINLRQLKEKLYMKGDRFIGDLKDSRWVVVRGVRINSLIDDDISTVTNIDRTGGTRLS